jgi:hypothetical protein
MIPLRPIEGAAELPLSVADYHAVKMELAVIRNKPLPPSTNEVLWVDTFLTSIPKGSRGLLINWPLLFGKAA